MMRHPSPAGSGPRLCQLCELVSSRQQPARSAKRPFVTLHAGRRLARPSSLEKPTWPVAPRLFTTSGPCLKAKRAQAVQTSQNLDASQNRFSRTVKSPDDQGSEPAQATPGGVASPPQRQQLEVADLAELAAAVDRVTKAFLAQPGIPSEHMTLTALWACGKTDIRPALDAQELQPEVPGAESPSETAASHLLDLDPAKAARKAGDDTVPKTNAVPSLRLQDVVDKLSNAAYAIITQPAVVITPEVLGEYVLLQTRLSKPESLPRVFELYASKPKPRLASGSIQYVERNPGHLENTVDPAIAEAALDAAIEVQDLDAAVGIVESTYATKASRRSKLLRKGLVPAATFGLTPVAVYLLASNLSLLQDTMDADMARNVAFAGILAYIGFTATIGVVASSTANDQMKRVTWAPGTPLLQRWLREDERAAFDKIACAFGFSEQHRFGEESGREFKLLREFLLGRGMILDAVELMPGMN